MKRKIAYKEGGENALIFVAKKMKIKGEPIEKIMDFTGLTPEQIENL
ncbi:MAG: hypothetical protein LIP09_10290 [Bacteroidales bacterium]|nr:hypothetical protein [Bacteroidales bacterium]